MFGRNECGQSTVEFVFCLPLIVVLITLLIQVGVVAVDAGRLWHAAREGARVAAVTDDREAIEEAAASAGVSPLEVFVDPSSTDRAQGSPVTVDVRHAPGASLPILGRFLSDLHMTASATMRIETP